MKTHVLLFSLIAISISLLTGCQNTAAGFGKDMQNTGEAIQQSVEGK